MQQVSSTSYVRPASPLACTASTDMRARERVTPVEVVRYVIDPDNPVLTSTELAGMLNRGDGLCDCNAVVVCEVTDDGSILNYALATRIGDGAFAPARYHVAMTERTALSVFFPCPTMQAADSMIVCDDTNSYGREMELYSTEGGETVIPVRRGQTSIIFLGRGITSQSLLIGYLS